MTGQLQITREEHLGIIALNRPEAINALSLEMIDGISRTLEDWRDDDGIRAVLFEGIGPRGFCSGGDVRAVRAAVLAGEHDQARAFFAAEYRMNGLIAGYRKPRIALSHGIVMGGGIGIAGHCNFRFTTPGARFAMPEAAIGFFTDVGVNAILAKAPWPRALLFTLSGLPVGAADAVALGLADCVVPEDRFADLRIGFVAAAKADNVDAALVALMQAHAVDAGEPVLCPLADLHGSAFGAGDAEAIVAGLAAVVDPRLAPFVKALAGRSPTSLETIVLSHAAARALGDIGAVLAMDLRLAVLLSGLPDFAEGVRALLIDKDQRPNWQPAGFAAVPRAAIEAAIGSG